MSTLSKAGTAVAFDNVCKAYQGTTEVVSNLNLAVGTGEFFTMLGPSGSGKTTSLMMLAGFETPTKGDIRLDGKSVAHVPPHERDIGMVFQNYALFPHMSVSENLAFPLTVRKLDRSTVRARVADIMKVVHLEGLEDRRPSQLSGGQQQRVALARSLVFHPKIVLMDEPLGALDKQLRETLQLEIKRIARTTGITVVYVTHDQSEALTVSDTIAVFNKGRVEQVASPTELYEWPANSFVASFIGDNNSLMGTVTAIEADWATVQLADGSHIKAQKSKFSKVGSKTRVSIRPERVRLGAFLNDNSLLVRKAPVLESRFMGDVIHTRVRLADNEDFLIKTHNTPGLQRPGPGQEVELGWLPADGLSLDA
ncbi:MAG: ABC transporter ATP-binding protein [Pseudomonadota bacterium]